MKNAIFVFFVGLGLVFGPSNSIDLGLSCSKTTVDEDEYFQCSVRVGFTCPSIALNLDLGNGTILTKTIYKSKA